MIISRTSLIRIISEIIEDESGPKSDILFITPNEAEQLIRDSKGAIFDVSFIKKDGTLRRMNARVGVKKYLKGGELKYDATSKGLIPVYDVQCGLQRKSDEDPACYRMINKNTLMSLRVGKQKYVINPQGQNPSIPTVQDPSFS